MPLSDQSITLKSRAGYPKPISPAQVAGLKVVDTGLVIQNSRHFRLYGIRTDVFEVLERNDLVEVLAEPMNPQSTWPNHQVVLTDRGRKVLEVVK